MRLLPKEALKTAAHKLDSLQSRAWLPPALLLLALSSVFIFGSERRGYFYREIGHNGMSAKNLAIAENLFFDHRFLPFIVQKLDAEGDTIYDLYGRFPIGSYALIKLAILPFGDNLSAKIYVAQMLMLLFFAAAAVLAYLSLRRLISSRWIALTAALLAFSSAYCLYWNDAISSESMVDIFGALLVFHGMAIFEQEGRFRQLLLKTCLALLLGWHVYAMLLPFIALGLARELIKARSGVSTHHSALCQLKHATLSLLRSRYMTLGVAALLFGISVLTFNFTNEYFALNRETPFTEIPSFRSMIYRAAAGSDFRDNFSWPAFMRLQFYRIGIMATPYIFSPPFREGMDVIMPRLFVILGIATFIASLIGALFARRHKILLASLTLSGFCWALPIRYNTAIWLHSHEALFYIGVTLTLFSLVLLLLRRLSGERLIAALCVAAALAFALSALRMSQLDHSDKRVERIRKAVVADIEVIRSMTDKSQVIKIITPPARGWDNYSPAFLPGRIIVPDRQTAPSARTPDFVVTRVFAEGFAHLTPQNREVFLYKWDDYQRYLDEVIEKREPLIRSDFDAHLIGDALMYAKDDCSADDISEKFFISLHPVDENALSDQRRQYGFDNRDFRFEDRIIRRGDRCIAITEPLPEYDIARISTGQFIQLPDGSYEHLWEGEVHMTQ